MRKLHTSLKAVGALFAAVTLFGPNAAVSFAQNAQNYNVCVIEADAMPATMNNIAPKFGESMMLTSRQDGLIPASVAASVLRHMQGMSIASVHNAFMMYPQCGVVIDGAPATNSAAMPPFSKPALKTDDEINGVSLIAADGAVQADTTEMSGEENNTTITHKVERHIMAGIDGFVMRVGRFYVIGAPS